MALHIGGLGHGGQQPEHSPVPAELMPLRGALASPARTSAESDRLMEELAAAVADGAFDTTDLTFTAKREIENAPVWAALVALAKARGATRFIAFGDTAQRMAPQMQAPFNHLELSEVSENVNLTALPACIGELTVDPAAAIDIQLPRELTMHIAPDSDAAALAASTVTIVGADGMRHSKPLAPPAVPAHPAAAAAAAGPGAGRPGAGGAAAAGAAAGGPAAGGPVAPRVPSPDDKRGGARDAATLRITESVPKRALGHLHGAAYCVVNHDETECTPFETMAPLGCAGAVAALPAGKGTLVVLPLKDKEGRVVYSLDGAIIRACRERGIQIQVYAKGGEQATAAAALRSQWQRDLTDELRLQDSHDVHAAMANPLFQRYARDKKLTEALDMWLDVQAWERSPEPNRAAFGSMQSTVMRDDGVFSGPLRRKLTGVDAATAPAATLKTLGDEIVREWTKQAADDARQWRIAQNRLLEADVVVRDAKAPKAGISAIGDLMELYKFLTLEGPKEKLPALTLYKLCFEFQRDRGTPLEAQRWDALRRAAGQAAPMRPQIDAALRGLTPTSENVDEAIARLMALAKRQLDDVLDTFERTFSDGVYRRR